MYVIPSAIMLLSVLMPSLPIVGCISLLTKAHGHDLQLLEDCYESNVEIPKKCVCGSIPCSSGENPKNVHIYNIIIINYIYIYAYYLKIYILYIYIFLYLHTI